MLYNARKNIRPTAEIIIIYFMYVLGKTIKTCIFIIYRTLPRTIITNLSRKDYIFHSVLTLNMQNDFFSGIIHRSGTVHHLFFQIYQDENLKLVSQQYMTLNWWQRAITSGYILIRIKLF